MTNCDECTWQDEGTGSCTNTVTDNIGELDCEGFNAGLPQLEPEDMFKILYMLIYTLGGQIEIPQKSFDNFGYDLKLIPEFDTEANKFIVKTSIQPPKNRIIKPKLFIGNA